MSLGPTGRGKQMQEELGTPMARLGKSTGKEQARMMDDKKNHETRGLVRFPGNQQKVWMGPRQ